MEREIQATIAQYAPDGRIVREVHAVPPYRVYEVDLGSRRAVLKVDDHPRAHAADEGRVHEYVATRTSAPVPEPIGVGDDHYVTAWHDELARSPESVEGDWARAAGSWLATLHADTAGAFEGFGRPRNGDGRLELAAHGDWVDAVAHRIGDHRTYLDGFGYADVADAVEAFFREHPGAFEGVGDPVLCHGDVHPEHHVRVGGEVLGIDFEHALVAPAEYDYWRTVMPYFEAPDDVDDGVKRVFREGYESVRSLPDGFEQRRPLYRLTNWVAFLESLYLQKTVEPAKRDQMGEWMRERAFETLERLREQT